MVMGVVPEAVRLAIDITVVPTVISATGKEGETNWKVPLSVSPVPTAFVPALKSDSNTLPSVPATAPSPKPTTAGTPTIVMVKVVVALSPSLSVTS